MLKIFSTQLSGYFKRIAEQEEMNIEDSARLLAQALVGDGHIYMYGVKEMQGVVLEALYGAEPLQRAKQLKREAIEEVTPADRVILISRFSTDEEAILLAKELQTQGHAVVGISAVKEGEESLEQFTDAHIDTKLLKALIPDEDGTRYGFPSGMTALFAYYGLKFTAQEILAEY
ncbi:DUF2529 domain-containing protein [Ectobacillus panaciterrae]|uniref:DUF2529 domain-containing protein n=1 Tax=Ectobacillus panaciterrae TaxID=363872 RepID=UPI00040838FA|nr:DUF2529 domain-containing protein [Ectobacillus panaciterrae]